MVEWHGEMIEAGELRMHVTRTGGGGAPLVLLHGLLGSGACWTPLAKALETEFDVVMPDARGHGASSAPDHGYRYDDHADDVLVLARTLDLTRPILLGHSMGGLTAAAVAQRRPRLLRGLVLVDPTFLEPARQQEVWQSDVIEQHRQALTRSASDLVAEARARHPHRSQEIVELQVEARISTRLQALDVLAPPNPEFRSLVRAIDVPTLLVIGDRGVVSIELADELRDSNPLLTVAVVPDAGHGLPFDQPEHLARIVAPFLRGLT